MERHRKPSAQTLVFAAALIVALAPVAFPPLLHAQSQTQPKGIDPKLLGKAEAGDAASQLLLANSYQARFHTGNGAAGDLDEAISWYHKAAENGDATAQFIIAWEYYGGTDPEVAPRNHLPKDYLQAADWFHRAAMHSESIDMAMVRGGPSNAAVYASTDVTMGRGSEYFFLGSLFDEGGDLPQDYSQAAFWYHKGADQGNAHAQSSLGTLYAEGKGVQQDYVQAATWFSEAADKGDSDAQSSLGALYEEGRGVPQDYSKALQLLKKAAGQGNAAGQFNLGRMYALGQGVPQDPSVAYLFFDLAAVGMRGQQQENAAKARDLAASLLTPEQITKVQEAAAKWFALHPPPR